MTHIKNTGIVSNSYIRSIIMPTIVVALLVSLCWVAWPMIAKQTGISNGWVILVVQSVSLIAAAPYLSEMRANGAPALSSIGLLLLAALVNAFGFYLYVYKGMDPSVRIDLFITIVFALTVVVAPVMHFMITKELPTLRQCMGAAVIVGGICIARS